MMSGGPLVNTKVIQGHHLASCHEPTQSEAKRQELGDFVTRNTEGLGICLHFISTVDRPDCRLLGTFDDKANIAVRVKRETWPSMPVQQFLS